MASGYLTRIGTCCPALSFTHAPSPGTASDSVSPRMSAIGGGGAPGGAPEHAAKSGMGHVFASSGATAEPSPRNHDCLSLYGSEPPAPPPVTSSSGKPACAVHCPISSLTCGTRTRPRLEWGTARRRHAGSARIVLKRPRPLTGWPDVQSAYD